MSLHKNIIARGDVSSAAATAEAFSILVKDKCSMKTFIPTQCPVAIVFKDNMPVCTFSY